MLVPFALYKNNKIIGVSKNYEDIEDFVEKLKILNPEEIDRRKYTIQSGETIIKFWTKK